MSLIFTFLLCHLLPFTSYITLNYLCHSLPFSYCHSSTFLCYSLGHSLIFLLCHPHLSNAFCLGGWPSHFWFRATSYLVWNVAYSASNGVWRRQSLACLQVNAFACERVFILDGQTEIIFPPEGCLETFSVDLYDKLFFFSYFSVFGTLFGV